MPKLASTLVDPEIVKDNPTTFIFHSESQEGMAHVIDLAENTCTCQHFQFRILPKIERGELSKKDVKARCKHILWAREMLLNDVIEFLKKGNDGEAENIH